ncbi:MAG: cytochrome c oxidase subunit 3 [Pyrinomonadaceae bacterium]
MATISSSNAAFGEGKSGAPGRADFGNELPGKQGRGGYEGDGGGGFDGSGDSEVNKSKILMWFLLLVVVMTFGGLIAAYVVVATNKALEWRPFDLPFQVWISTLIILVSSLTYHFANKYVQGDRFADSRRWFVATAVFGATFISSQILAWMALVNRGLYMRENPYAGFFYILTAIHAVHVIGGICGLGYVTLRVWNSGKIADQAVSKLKMDSRVVGWYWHTMDLLWLILLFLLGFWK